MNELFEKLALGAKVNLFNLGGNPYPGRLIVVGLDETGENLVQVYAIMGRSENSRNRVFGCGDNGRLFTEAADSSKTKDPSLIIYNAMREAHTGIQTLYVVSNGHQTDAVADECSRNSLVATMIKWEYEPDAPNFTPRITSVTYWGNAGFPISLISILRKSVWSGRCDRHLFGINDIGRGFGYCFHTYSGDGDPLPAFRGEPYLVPLIGDANQIADTFWQALNADNRVSLAVKFIPKDGPSNIFVINKYEKVG